MHEQKAALLWQVNKSLDAHPLIAARQEEKPRPDQKAFLPPVLLPVFSGL